MWMGLHEAMSMAEGMMFRLEKAGDAYAPPGSARMECSVMGVPMLCQTSLRKAEDGGQKACISLSLLRGEDTASWELWLDSACRWESKLFSGGRTLLPDEWEIDGAVGYAVRMRNAGLE